MRKKSMNEFDFTDLKNTLRRLERYESDKYDIGNDESIIEYINRIDFDGKLVCHDVPIDRSIMDILTDKNLYYFMILDMEKDILEIDII